MKQYLFAEEWRGRLRVESMRIGDWQLMLGLCSRLRSANKVLDPVEARLYRVYEFDTEDPKEPRNCHKDIMRALVI